MEKSFGLAEVRKHGGRKAIDKEGQWVPQSQFVVENFEGSEGECDRK